KGSDGAATLNCRPAAPLGLIPLSPCPAGVVPHRLTRVPKTPAEMTTMQLGMIGLGRMGGNMVLRLLRHGHSLVAYDRNPDVTRDFDAKEKTRADKADSVAGLVKMLKPPRAVWVMLPAGKITEDCIKELTGLMSSGDTIIDGGNTMFKDDVRRAQELKPKGIT